MNDDELMTVLREQRGKVPMTVPVEQIVSRGRVVRARRRVPYGAAALGTAGAAAIAVSVALPGHPAAEQPAASNPVAGHPVAGHPAGSHGVQLAAWTVTREDDGSIAVTFREAVDPAGVQRTLRADGVPASVTFASRQNPACRSVTGPVGTVFGHYRLHDHLLYIYNNHPQDVLVIRPQALPSGEGVQILITGTRGAPNDFLLHRDLVQASPQCTGS
jgi:hypothetical protein